MRGINKEIEDTTNALIYVIENFKFQNISTTNAQIKEELDKRLGKAKPQKEESSIQKTVFKDFFAYLDYYIDQCRAGIILNSKGLKLAPDTIRNYTMTRVILKKYSADKHVQLTLDSINMDFTKIFYAI
jgi:hypothetical protein